jgi:hypothetical protein
MHDDDCINDFDASTCGTGDPVDCNTLSADLSDEFTSHATRDYTQQSDAVSIDTGASTGAPSEDYAGNDRPVNSLYDIGAYEYGTDLGFTGVTVQ